MPEPSSNTDLPLADSRDGTTTWCSTADVATITGATVTDDDIARAQFIIDIASGRSAQTATMLAGYLHRRDLYYLRLATAYQTVWMKSQPDMFTRMDVTGVNQDGIGSSLANSALKLSPLAKACLRRLSWKGTRSMRIGQRDQVNLSDYMNPNAPIVDTEGEIWSALGETGDADARRGPIGSLEF